MKQPCVKECPDRQIRCRETCERYREYRAWRDTMYEQRQKDFIVTDFSIKSMNKQKGYERRHKRK